MHQVRWGSELKDRDLAIVTMDDDDAVEETDGRGTMVIRVWSEPAGDGPFRARLTFSRTSADQPQVSVVTSPEQLLETVRQWLAEAPG